MILESIIEQIENKKLRRAYDSPAKDLKDNLKKMTENISDYQKRWFWELLQNACDFNESVRVELKIDRKNNKLSFKHNGKPFTVEEAMNLIAPDTSKDKADRVGENHVIGKFGTGFISTHVLASRITVNGQILNQNANEKKEFSFLLDRTGFDNRDLLIDSITLAEKQLVEQQKDYLLENYETTFIYDLVSCYSFINTEDTIAQGLSFMGEVLPYVFSFNDTLTELTVKDDNDTIIVKKIYTPILDKSSSGISQINIEGYLKNFPVYANMGNVRVWSSGNWHRTEESSPYSRIACSISSGRIVSIKHLPKIFCDFPLIGSEAYPFPIVINSHQFIPTSDRNDISLTSPLKTNLTILELSAAAYKQLLNYCQGEVNSIENIWEIANINTIETTSPLVNILELYYNHLLNAKLVRTRIGYSDIKDCFFCYKGAMSSESFLIFAALSHELLDNLPNESDSVYWSNYLPLNNKLFEKNKFTIDKLLVALKEGCTTLDEVTTKFHLTQPKGWLLKLYILIKEINEIKYFEKFDILLNSNDLFIKVSDNLFWSDNLNEKLAESYKLLFNSDLKNLIIDSYFSIISNFLPSIKTLTNKELCKIIDEKMKQTYDRHTEADYVQCVVNVLGYTSNMDVEVIHEYFPWFAMNRLSFVLSTIANPKDEGKYFDIYKSGKIDILSQIAVVPYTDSELKIIANNPTLIKFLIENKENVKNFIENESKLKSVVVDGFKMLIIDDEQYANSATGDHGELLVFEELKRIFDSPEYQVIWASKNEGQPAYDFRVLLNGDIFIYVDAKTTTTAMTQSGSIPFFLKKSQWEFIQTLQDKYWIARVFLGDQQPSIKFLKVSMHQLL